MSVLKLKNISHEVAEILGDRIVRMELKPGERIIEAKVAKEFNVSQSSVREAFRILEQGGLVAINQRRGSYVTELSIDDVGILYDIVAELYVVLITRAMEKKNEANAQLILDALAWLEAAAAKNDVDRYYQYLFEFAIIAIDAVGSPLLRKVLMDLWPNKKRVEYMVLKAQKRELKNNFKYFKRLGGYMMESDVEKMAKLIREYTQNEKATAISILTKKTGK